MRKQALLCFILVGISLHILSCASHQTETHPLRLLRKLSSLCLKNITVYPWAAIPILFLIERLPKTGLLHRIVDHRFINDKESFFDDNGKRRFRVLISPEVSPFGGLNKLQGKELPAGSEEYS